MKIEVAYEEKIEEVKVKVRKSEACMKHDFYYVNENGGVLGYVPNDPDGEDLSYMKYQKEIGNHFKTREEAELAVRKLKAWRRLKDKGFRFEGWDGSIKDNAYFIKCTPMTIDDPQTFIDLDILFGGEE